MGPVGAVFASLCARSGLSVRIVERDMAVYRLPRAVAMDHEVLRLVGLIGVAGDVLDASRPSEGYEFVSKDREILVARYQTEPAPTRYRYSNMFHQPSFEEAVRARLVALPGVTVNVGCEVTGIEQDPDGVTALVETPDGVKSVAAEYAVGCDGGRSLVRRSLGTGMRDLGFDEPWLVVDVRLAGGVEAISSKGIQLCDPDRPTTSTQSGPGRHRWEFMLKPDETADEVTGPDSIRKWISSWVDPDTVTIERSAVYRFHGLVAESWRDRRVMIIGDAAHQMPPFLGQGLCSGIRDAFNLAWKLLAVARGEADTLLLDTVQTERAPHVTAITEIAIALGKIVCITDRQAAAERDRKFRADREAGRSPTFPRMPKIEYGILDEDAAGTVLPEPFVANRWVAGAGDVRVDDIAGYAPLLIVGDCDALSAADRAAVEQLKGLSGDLRVCSVKRTATGAIEVIDADGHMESLLGDCDALLAKPDRIVFGRGSVPELAAAWREYLQGECFPRGTAIPGPKASLRAIAHG